MKQLITFIATLLMTTAIRAVDLPPRAIDLCQNWRFFREDVPTAATTTPIEAAEATVAFDDSTWEKVSLPHSVKIESPEIGANYFLGGCWYRRVIAVDPSWQGKRVSIEFDGAMQKADIWVNGEKAGSHLGGYLPFVIDLTPHLIGQDRLTIVLHLDNRSSKEFPPGKNQVDFTYQGGLYRPARLVVTDPVHITNPIEANRVAGGGVFVRCSSADEKSAVMIAQTDERNDGSDPTNIAVEHVLLAPDGGEVARENVPVQPLAPKASFQFTSTFTIASPKLWHPDHPWLYTLISTVIKNGKPCDQMRTRCGLRWLTVNESGFFLNGEKIVFRGANRHMSFPWLGNAGSDGMEYRDIRLLKEGGFNFVRLPHYPHNSATMDACDELGIMAIVCTPGWQNFANNDSFKTEAKKNIGEMVRWHRNHPSAVLWEVSLNETYGHDSFYAECSDIAKAEYPGGQLLTSGDTYGSHHISFYDIPYLDWKGFYKRDPNPDSKYKMGLAREYGDYEFGGQSSTTRVPRSGGEDKLMLQAWNYQWSHNQNLGMPWMVGDAIWAGIDTASTFDQIPSKGLGSWWGPLDLYRLPKFSYYFFQSQRDPAVKRSDYDSGPMVHIAGYWTPRPSPAKVIVYSNCEEVELFLNGKSIGKHKPDNGPDGSYRAYLAEADPMYWTKNKDTFVATKEAEDAAKAKPAKSDAGKIFDGGNCRHLDHPPFTFVPVAYETGELKAVGRIAGQIVATNILRTPGRPAALRLSAATLGKPLIADASDSLFVYGEVVDSVGEVVPENGPVVTFSIAGHGHLVMPPKSSAEMGIAPMIVQSSVEPGTITVTATASGVAPATLELRSQLPGK